MMKLNIERSGNMFHKFLLSLCQGLKSLLKAVLYFIGGLLVLVALLEIYVVFEKNVLSD